MSQRSLWTTMIAGALVASTTGCATSTSWFGSGGSWWGTAKKQTPSESSFADNKPKSESSWLKWPTWGGDDKADENDPISTSNMPKKPTPELFESVALAAEKQGNYVEAIKQYQTGLKAHPNNVPLLMGMARAYDRAGHGEYAIETYQRVIKVDPKYAKVHNDMALCLARNKDLPAAIASMERAIEIDPKSELYRNNIATMLVDLGQHEAAFGQMQAVQPPAYAHYNMGYLLQSRGQPTLAKKHLETALRIDPNVPRARVLLERVDATALASESIQDTTQKVARIGTETADRWKMQTSQAGESLAGYGQTAAQNAYREADQRVATARDRASDAVRQAQATTTDAVRQTQNSVYGEAQMAQASAYSQADRWQRKAQQAFDSYAPAGPQGNGSTSPPAAKPASSSVYGSGSAPAGAEASDEEEAIPLAPAR